MNKKMIDELMLRLIVAVFTLLFGVAVQSLRSISHDISDLQKTVLDISMQIKEYDSRLKRLESISQR